MAWKASWWRKLLVASALAAYAAVFVWSLSRGTGAAVPENVLFRAYLVLQHIKPHHQ